MSAHPIGIALALYLLALLIIYLLDTAATRDPGGYDESARTFLNGFYRWPYDKVYHGGLSLLLGGLTAYFFRRLGVAHAGPWAIAFVMLAGLGIELIEWHPRHEYPNSRRGRFSGWDLLADFLGAVVGAPLGAVI
jgi:hypothetical protein